jgi:hypothetical protein
MLSTVPSPLGVLAQVRCPSITHADRRYESPGLVRHRPQSGALQHLDQALGVEQSTLQQPGSVGTASHTGALAPLARDH